jgi:hypothetical protein
MSRNEWNFLNRKKTTREKSPEPRAYVKRGYPVRKGKRFKWQGYDGARLEDLPPDLRTAADLLKVGESVEIFIKKPQEYKPRRKRLERTF